MKKQIISQLLEIEKQEGIKILFACESGSRAWGFPSSDSDFDVRFIYCRPVDHYLSIEEKADFINYPENQNLDIEGWDLMKALRLVRKSNTTIFEWLQSPVIYHEEIDFRNKLWDLCRQYFCMKSNMHHYLGIAKGAFDTIIHENEIKIKKLFYVLRPLLAAKWCYQQRSIAPMSVFPLLDAMPLPLKETVLTLIKLKETSAEGFLIRIEPALLTYIEHEFAKYHQEAVSLHRLNFEVNVLDSFFKNTLIQYDH